MSSEDFTAWLDNALAVEKGEMATDATLRLAGRHPEQIAAADQARVHAEERKELRDIINFSRHTKKEPSKYGTAAQRAENRSN